MFLQEKLPPFFFSLRWASLTFARLGRHFPTTYTIKNAYTGDRRQGSPSSKITEMQNPDVAPPLAPLRRLRIPCICGEAHASSTCPAANEPAATKRVVLPHPSTTKKATATATATTTLTTPPTPPAQERQCRKGKKKIKPTTSSRRWKEFQRQARRRKLAVVMEKRHYHLLTKQPCAYCGRKIGNIGVDRVCNSEPYTAENTLPCCSVCNFMKRDLGLGAFVSAAKAVSNGPMSGFAELRTDQKRPVSR